MTKNQLSMIKGAVGVLLMLVGHFMPEYAATLTPIGIAMAGWAVPRIGKDAPGSP